MDSVLVIVVLPGLLRNGCHHSPLGNYQLMTLILLGVEKQWKKVGKI